MENIYQHRRLSLAPRTEILEKKSNFENANLILKTQIYFWKRKFNFKKINFEFV